MVHKVVMIVILFEKKCLLGLCMHMNASCHVIILKYIYTHSHYCIIIIIHLCSDDSS